MRKNLTRAMLAALALFIAVPAYADGPGDGGPNEAAPPVRAAPTTPPPAAPSTQPTAAPEGRSGVIPLGNDGLSLNVPASYRFYSAAEARAYLQRANQQAPSGEIYGLLARNGQDIRAPDTWATVVSYDAIGYVQPETASGLSDANFETSVRDARQTQSRRFEGFATAPSFNAEAPYVVWAERVAAPGGAGGKDLRYEQKIMGRNGVAGMTSIGSADQQPAIAAAATELRAMLSFPQGKRHADFQAASDTVSNYSVPGLVTGVPTAQAQTLVERDTKTGAGQTAFGGLSGYFPWIALGVIVLAGAGYLLMRRRDDDEEEYDEA
ncbi:DUF2167 domain-containing protein [Candidatus Viadribacter manganicus]|uniref:DUF2167 domain-containing protein n=1 Tax=Candidatus Viadribacter manganicus TaxID=1759059 RepID=A0A1B1AHV0_9PROT|nr:DUF2167 domain-containing protein [Candidatus Viadribacter manganicus]ANP46146.1 hypothetical protein ATE48_09550 [Candidatus Viadribacter manganicus]